MFFSTSDGTKLYYEIKGTPDAPVTVALLNGVMASVTSWVYLLPMLTRLNVRILLHDFEGQLLSDKPNHPYGFKRHCEQLKELLDHIQAHKAHLIGTSYGSEIAMLYASLYPEQVQSLVLIDGASELDDDLIQKVTTWKKNADHPDGSFFFREMMKDIYGTLYLQHEKKNLDERAKLFQTLDRSYFEGQKHLYDAFLRDLHLTSELHKIRCPALVICGEEDTLKPVYFSEIIAKTIKNSEFIVIPHSGHVTIFEKPNELNSAIGGFLLKHIQ